MFKFLKSRNLFSGDARRHVPFASIIHKPFFLFFALVFSFVSIVPVKVHASAPQIHPEFKPILDTDIVNFQDSYLNLDPAAQAAASILFGAYVTEYAGLADYGTVFDEVPTDGTVWDRLEFAGQQLIDTFFLPYNMADQLVLTPLINLGQGIINKVKGVSDIEEFKQNIMVSEDYKLLYNYDIGFSLNQVLAREGGLYNWQQRTIPTNELFDFIWDVSGSQGLTLSYLNQFTESGLLPPIRGNSNLGSYYNFKDYAALIPHVELFLNYSTGLASFYHNGNVINSFNGNYYALTGGGNSTFYSNSNPYPNFNSTYFTDVEYGGAFFNNTLSPSNAFNSIRNLVYIRANGIDYSVADSVIEITYGDSYANKQRLIVTSDLGFIDTDSLQLLNPINDLLFDLKQLVQEIVNAKPDPNLELPLKPIIYNITQVNGDPLTAEDLQGISFNVTPPESGIDIPVNAFLPMFDNGKGFISYMWYMTKPLVAYTRSLLDVLTFDPVDGFNASGPGYFVLGVAGLGLIGGVIVKFLL